MPLTDIHKYLWLLNKKKLYAQHTTMILLIGDKGIGNNTKVYCCELRDFMIFVSYGNWCKQVQIPMSWTHS